MSNEEFIIVRDQLILVTRLLVCLDLENFITLIDQADTLGPILDPTLWRAAHVNMERLKELAVAARVIQMVVKTFPE